MGVRVLGGTSDVYIQDQHTEVIDLHLTQQIQDVVLTTDTTLYDTTITISSVAEPTNGHLLNFKEDDRFLQVEIVSHSANSTNWDCVIDSPLDYAFTTAAFAKERNENLNVNGSVTPVVFAISTRSQSADWDITKIIFTITDDVVMDDAKFGGISALTRGVLFRTVNGDVKNIFNAKSNYQFMNHCGTVEYSDKAPAGVYGLRGQRVFAGQGENGVTLRLTGGGFLEALVQDDLTDLNTFKIVAQGHVVD